MLKTIVHYYYDRLLLFEIATVLLARAVNQYGFWQCYDASFGIYVIPKLLPVECHLDELKKIHYKSFTIPM